MLDKYILNYKKIIKNNEKLNLEKDEIEALNSYKGMGFMNINNTLRQNIINLNINELKNKPVKLIEYVKDDFNKINEKIKNIDNSINKCQFLPKGLKAYRGYRINQCEEYKLKSFLEKLEKDKKIKNAEFLSISLNENVAKSFSFSTNNLNKKVNNNIIFIITFPQKTKAFPLTWNFGNENIKNEVVQSSEVELLLPRDGQFILKKKTEEELEVPKYRWKNINDKVPTRKFTCYYVDYIPVKKPSIVEFNKNNYDVKISPELYEKISI
jgi:hypothetical protein